MDPEETEEREVEEDDDESDLRRRTFLERHDWIPWIAAAVVVGGASGFLFG